MIFLALIIWCRQLPLELHQQTLWVVGEGSSGGKQRLGVLLLRALGLETVVKVISGPGSSKVAAIVDLVR